MPIALEQPDHHQRKFDMYDNNPLNSLAMFYALRELSSDRSNSHKHRTTPRPGLFASLARLIRGAFRSTPAQEKPATRLEMRRLKEAALAARRATRTPANVGSFSTSTSHASRKPELQNFRKSA
jgi:hypothetical protein